MKSAFLTEMGFAGQIPSNHNNMRTEFAWMYALKADHFNIHNYSHVHDYDVVFIIFPKATVKLNAVGIEMTTPEIDKDISIYSSNIVTCLKQTNQIVCAIQEGPAWFFNEYDLVNQFNFYNQLAECNIIFAHNEYDTHFYKGLFPQTRVKVIPTLMIINNDTCPFIATPENKAIIGGNFCRWYGGFQSYLVATEFQCPIYVPASHCKRKGEEQVPNLKHLPWVFWTKWMEQLSTFKYAVNLMPTIAAGTFSLNCAYYGIPCIGNEKVDTQIKFFPELSVDIHDIHQARHQAILLLNKDYYEGASHYAKSKFKDSPYGNVNKWLEIIKDAIYA
ncbi:MAG TPA: hypothetical protein PLC59_00135 [Bacteroidales bacterium]|jgi:hypothetical protein|nr:hypothetical protein [Bacteroidales bacterium]